MSDFDEIVAGIEPSARFDPITGKPINPETGKPVTPIEHLNRVIVDQDGNAEILAVKQVGMQDAKWIFTVRSKRTGEPVKLKSLETRKLETLSNLTARVREADGGQMPRPRAGSAQHTALMNAIDAAKEVHETGASEDAGWHRKVAAYIEHYSYRGKLPVRDIADPDERRHAIEEPEPFVDSAGRLHVNAGHFLVSLEGRRGSDPDVSESNVWSALRELDFERLPKKLQTKIDGIPAGKHFWRAPDGFDWRSDG